MERKNTNTLPLCLCFAVRSNLIRMYYVLRVSMRRIKWNVRTIKWVKIPFFHFVRKRLILQLDVWITQQQKIAYSTTQRQPRRRKEESETRWRRGKTVYQNENIRRSCVAVNSKQQMKNSTVSRLEIASAKIHRHRHHHHAVIESTNVLPTSTRALSFVYSSTALTYTNVA